MLGIYKITNIINNKSYIGKSSDSSKVVTQQYHGSVSSKKYHKIWKEELQNNPHLFRSFIISHHDTEEELDAQEIKLQTKLNVVKNPLYVNMCIGRDKFGGSGERNGMFGKRGNETMRTTG